MANELVEGVKVSVVEEGKVFEGAIAKCNDDGTFDINFKNGDEGVYEAKEITVIAEPEPEDTVTLTETITIPKSKVSISSQIAANPVLLAKEEQRQADMAKRRAKNRRAKITAPALPPMKVRENLLKARLRKVNKKHVHTYRMEQIIVWTQELRMIQNDPDQWAPGKVRAKKKKSAQDYIDGLNIDE